MSTKSHEFGSNVEKFLIGLRIPSPLPDSVEVLRPYRNATVRAAVRHLCETFYSDAPPRLSIWGINPGRFGAGLTGLAFTDPFAWSNDLRFESCITGRRELSAEFVYRVIAAYGGPMAFYRDFYLSALSPLGFVRGTSNLNFYDDPELLRVMVPLIQRWTKKQISFGLRTDSTVVLGTGKLRHCMEEYVRTQCGFSNVVYLEHPRFIMQYRRRQVESYIQKYVDTLLKLRSESACSSEILCE